MVLMTIYKKSPVFIQNVMTSLRGLQIMAEKNGKHYHRYLRFLEQFDYSNKELIEEYQNKKLQRLIRFAVDNTSFYKEFYKGIDIDKIRTARDLEKLPVLDKETVRNNLNKMYTIDEADAFVSHTSGTMGKALKYLHTYEGLQLRNAFLDDFKRRHGFINGAMRKASFGASIPFDKLRGKRQFWRDNLPLKERIYSAFDVQEENLKYYVDNLNEFKPASIDGYPSAIHRVAHYINQNNISLTFQPVAIFPTAETLLPHYREEIERAFNCRVFDQYASSEGAPFITECEEGCLHYNMLSGVIEQAEDNEMLITTFMNDGTPLIRYKIGDLIEFDTEKKSCDCGSALPIVKELQGRTSDFVASSSRGKLTSIFLAIESDIYDNSIVEMQYVQNKMDHVILNIVPDVGFTQEMEDFIHKELIGMFGEEMEVEIRRVPKIEKGKSGKFKFIVNNLGKELTV